MPDERQLNKGIAATNVPALLRSMVDSLVWESTRIDDGYVSEILSEPRALYSWHMVEVPVPA